MRKYYVYIDYTLEEAPRPFYVGKGSNLRVKSLKRNKKHTEISTIFGIKREILYETFDENESFEKEKQYIKQFHTSVKDPEASEIVCNLTIGGDGIVGIHTRCVEQYLPEDLTKPIRVYPSIESASNALSIDYEILHQYITRKKCNKILNGYYWKFAGKKGTKSQPKNINTKPILQFDQNDQVINEFNSLNDVCLFLSVDRNRLRTLMRKNAKEQMIKKFNSYFDYKFEKDKNFHLPTLSEEHRKIVKNASTNKIISDETRQLIAAQRSKPVLMFKDETFVQEFPSVKAVAKFFNRNKNSILAIMHYGNSTVDGYRLQFKFDHDNETQGFKLSNEAREKISMARSKFVIKQYDLDGIYIKTYKNFIEVEKEDINFLEHIHTLQRKPRDGKKYEFCGFLWEITPK